MRRAGFHAPCGSWLLCAATMGIGCGSGYGAVLLAPALGLLQAGHTVTLATHPCMRGLVYAEA